MTRLCRLSGERDTGHFGLDGGCCEMIGKFKLSQNREQGDFDSVAQGLTHSGQVGLSEAVTRTREWARTDWLGTSDW